MNKPLVIVLLMASISACTSYKTNTNITFDSTDMQGLRPSIYVGEVTEKPEELELLGWIEAEVIKPNIFAEDPTEEQAAIVLAKQGAELGGNAVVYVNFKKRMGAAFLRKMTARGQVVKLKTALLDETTIPEAEKPVPALQPITQSKSSAVTVTSQTQSPETTASTEPAMPAVALPTVAATTPDPTTTMPDTEVPSNEEILKIPVNSWQKARSPVSLQQHLENNTIPTVIVTDVAQCKVSINELVDYEYKVQTYKFMLANAKYLLKKSRGLKDEDMTLASERLIRQITQQQEWLKTQKPKE